MPFRPTAEHRKNIRGVIYPLTEAIRRLYGTRVVDGAYPIGVFYTINIDSHVWLQVEGVWYRPENPANIEDRSTDNGTVELFLESIDTGADVHLLSGKVVSWEQIPDSEAAKLPERVV